MTFAEWDFLPRNEQKLALTRNLGDALKVIADRLWPDNTAKHVETNWVPDRTSARNVTRGVAGGVLVTRAVHAQQAKERNGWGLWLALGELIIGEPLDAYEEREVARINQEANDARDRVALRRERREALDARAASVVADWSRASDASGRRNGSRNGSDLDRLGAASAGSQASEVGVPKTFAPRRHDPDRHDRRRFGPVETKGAEMARKLKDTAGPATAAPKGHNRDPLTDDDEAALHAYFRLKINAAEKEAATAKAAYDENRGVVTDLFASVKSELRIKRKDFEDMLAKAAMSDSEFRAEEAKRIRLFTLNGLPVGQQLTLPLGGTQDAAADQADAYNHGLRAGESGLDPTPPDFISPIMHPEWMRGWHDGQGRIAARMMRAQEIIAARAAPKAPEEEPEPEPEFDPAKAARKLKNDPKFMDRAAPADDQAEAA